MPRIVDVDVRRRDIAAAVRRVLARDGVDAVTMRNVSAELGSTTGLVTHWVPNRAALIQLALTDTADEQIQRAEAVLSKRPDDIIGALEEFMPLDAARLIDMKVWLGFWALAISDPALQRQHRDRYRDLRHRLASGLRGLGMPGSRATSATDSIMAAVDGIAVAAVFDADHWTPARQRRQIRHLVAQAIPELASTRR